MFHKASTEAERQKIFDDYILSILKQKQVVKKTRRLSTNKSSVMTQL